MCNQERWLEIPFLAPVAIIPCLLPVLQQTSNVLLFPATLSPLFDYHSHVNYNNDNYHNSSR